MLYNIEMLRFQRKQEKQPIQICWCAATTKNFVGTEPSKVTEEEVGKVDVTAVCEIIINSLTTDDDQQGMSLYYSSQLTYGAIRIWSHQILSFAEKCESFYSTILSHDDLQEEEEESPKPKKKKLNDGKIGKEPAKKSKKTPQAEPSEVLNISQIDQLPDVNLQEIISKMSSKDVNLMEEVNTLSAELSEVNLLFGETDPAQTIDDVIATLQSALSQQDGTQAKQQENINPNFQDNQVASQNLSPAANAKLLRSKLLRTPTKRSHILHGTPANHPSASSSESAKTAFSPPVRKRPRVVLSPLNISKFRNLLSNHQQDNDDAAIPADEPIQEASLPDDRIPAEFSSDDNLSNARQRAIEVQHEILPPSLELSDLTMDVDAPITDENVVAPVDEQPIVHNIVLNSNNKDAQQIASTNNELAAESEEKGQSKLSAKEPVKSKRGKKKQVFDKVISLEMVERSPGVHSTTLNNYITLDIYGKESVRSLMGQPSRLKRKRYNDGSRFWADQLLKLFRDRTLKPCENPARHAELESAPDEASQKNDQMDIDGIEPYVSQSPPPPPAIPAIDNIAIMNELRVVLQRVQIPAVVEPHNTQPEDNVLEQNQQHADVYVDVQRGGFMDGDNDVSDNTSLKNFEAAGKDMTNSNLEETTYLPLADFFASIEVHWQSIQRNNENNEDQVKVTFREIVSPQTCSRVEVVNYLIYCFILESEGKLYLEQRIPYEELYIVKAMNQPQG